MPACAGMTIATAMRGLVQTSVRVKVRNDGVSPLCRVLSRRRRVVTRHAHTRWAKAAGPGTEPPYEDCKNRRAETPDDPDCRLIPTRSPVTDPVQSNFLDYFLD